LPPCVGFDVGIFRGTSADRQIALYNMAKAGGRKRLTALKDVVDWAATQTAAV
jgi:hypothetical protein